MRSQNTRCCNHNNNLLTKLFPTPTYKLWYIPRLNDLTTKYPNLFVFHLLLVSLPDKILDPCDSSAPNWGY